MWVKERGKRAGCMRVPHRDTVRVTMSREQPQKQVTEKDKMVAGETHEGWASGVGGAGKVGGTKDRTLPSHCGGRDGPRWQLLSKVVRRRLLAACGIGPTALSHRAVECRIAREVGQPPAD